MTLPCSEKLTALFRGVASEDSGENYCMNCFHSFRTKGKLKSDENMCKNHDYRHVKISEEFNQMLMCNQRQKSLKMHLSFMQIRTICSKKYTHVKAIQKSHSHQN